VRVRQTVFDSASEREIFRSLDSRWSPRLRLYPQLPLAKLIDLEPVDSLPDNERRFFYSTNVDYTFCEPSGKPLFAIEFDGIGGGFSSDGVYVPARATSDPNRPWKLDFKLRAARAADFPLAVVSFEEAGELSAGDSLTVLDCLIGRCLAKIREEELIREFLEERKGFIDSLSPIQEHEYVQDLVFEAGITAELENDPLELEVERLKQELGSRIGSLEIRRDMLFDPPLPESDEWLPPPSIVEERIRGFEEADRVGCRVAVKTPGGGLIRTTWIRNVGSDLRVLVITVAENVAMFRALRDALASVGAEADRVDAGQ
jgi:hypothetical protein